MAHSIDIISKEFQDTDELLQRIKDIAMEKSLQYTVKEEQAIDVWVPETITLEIHFLTQKKYEALKKDSYWGDGYSVLFYITVYGEDEERDHITLPLLKELFEYYPDLSVFNEEAPAGKPFVYTKEHLDGFGGTSFAGIFTSPPEDLSNTA